MIDFFRVFIVLPTIIAPFVGLFFFLSFGDPFLAVVLGVFGVLYILNILDARRDVPKHIIDVIRFAKDGTPIKIKRWMLYYNFDKVVRRLRESGILTPLRVSERAFEIYNDVLKLSRELESFFEDLGSSMMQISSSFSQVSKAFADVISKSMSEIYSAWMENKIKVDEGFRFLEGNLVLFEEMGSRFGGLVNGLEGSEGSVKTLLKRSGNLRDIGRFISVLSYQISLESVKYKNSANILRMVNEMRALADNTREITLRSIENLEELDEFLVENLRRLEGMGFGEVVKGAMEIGERFSEIEDSVNKIAQRAGLVSRTVEEASSSLTEMGMALDEINVSMKDLIGDISTIRKVAESMKDVIENLKGLFLIKEEGSGGGGWVIWAYAAFKVSYSIILLLSGYILWKENLLLPSLILFFGGIGNFIISILLRITTERYVFSIIEGDGGYEIASAFVPMEAVKEYIKKELYEKPKENIEILILSLNSLLDKTRETMVSIKEINSYISQISAAVKQISTSFDEILKPSVEELKELSEYTLKSSQKGYQTTLENIKGIEDKIEDLGRIIADLEKVSLMARGLEENAEGISRTMERLNLVSINATVEAYKMGEGGPFEVVSREIRSLSEKSNLIIEGINKGMGEVKERVEEIMRERSWWEGNLQGVRERAKGIVKVFEEISERIERSDEMVKAITQALYESTSAVEESYAFLKKIEMGITKMSESIREMNDNALRILEEVNKSYEKA